MATIYHNFQIKAPLDRVFKTISEPEGIKIWWSVDSEGKPGLNQEYRFYFGPEYDWKGIVTSFEKNRGISWRFTEADSDWTGTTLSLRLSEDAGLVNVVFEHSDWKETNDHFKISSYCWGQYMRTLKRYCELGEVLEYHDRGGS